MSKRKRSYAEKINYAAVLAEGLRKHLDQLSAVGLGEAFVQDLDNQRTLVEDINVNQERLKAELKTVSAQLNREMKKLDRQTTKGRSIVKLELPLPQWKEFGIEDKT
jgi:hypothetical protein